MPSPVPRRSPHRSSGGERVFADDVGRLWCAALEEATAGFPDTPARRGHDVARSGAPPSGDRRGAGSGERAVALVFACLTDARQPTRAIAVDPAARLADAADEMLRGWLRDAPAVGRLS